MNSAGKLLSTDPQKRDSAESEKQSRNKFIAEPTARRSYMCCVSRRVRPTNVLLSTSSLHRSLRIIVKPAVCPIRIIRIYLYLYTYACITQPNLARIGPYIVFTRLCKCRPFIVATKSDESRAIYIVICMMCDRDRRRFG